MLILPVLTACEMNDEPTEPALAASFAQSTDAAGAAGATAAQLAELRRVTARFHTLAAARQAGYEARITPCWAHHAAGAMGYHYGNPDLFDATVDLLNPELLMFEPQAGGHMQFVGMEYLVPLQAWEDAGHDLDDPADVPELLGRSFTRHDVLPIFKLHIWLWRNNPSGMFADWNPKVSCAHAETTETF